MSLESRYLEYLENSNPKIYKIPFIRTVDDLTDKIPVTGDQLDIDKPEGHTDPTWEQLRDINVRIHRKTSDRSIQIYQRGRSISDVGRMQGNLEYLEDRWNVQIQPPAFKYAFINKGKLDYTNAKQSKIRDKYLKIKVRYDGKQYVIVNAIKTKYTISYV